MPVFRDDLRFETTDQSLWGPGEAAVFDWSDFFGIDWAERESVSVTRGRDVRVPNPTPDPFGILPDTIKVGTSPTDATFGVRSEGRVGFDVGFFFDSGSVDADQAAEVTIDLAVPARAEVGETAKLSTRMELGAGGFTTNFPELRAYLDQVFELEFGVFGDVDGRFVPTSAASLIGAGPRSFGPVRFDQTLIDVAPRVEIAALNRDDDGEVRLIGGTPGDFQFGEEVPVDIGPPKLPFPVNVANLRVFLPDLETEGTRQGDGYTSAGKSEVFRTVVDLDGVATLASGGSVPPFETTVRLPDRTAGALTLKSELFYNTIDVEAGPSFPIEQRFDWSPAVETRFRFDAPVTVTVDGTARILTETPWFADAPDIEIELGERPVAATAEHRLANTFSNETALALDFVFELTALEARADLLAEIDLRKLIGQSGTVTIPFAIGLGPLIDEAFPISTGLSDPIFTETFSLDGFPILETSFLVPAGRIARLQGTAGDDILTVRAGETFHGGAGFDRIEVVDLAGELTWRDPSPRHMLVLVDRELGTDRVRLETPADPAFDSARLRIDLDGDGTFDAGEPAIVLSGLARADYTIAPSGDGGTVVRLSGPDLPLTDLPLVSQVNALYVVYFGRAGEPDGIAYWTGVYQDALDQGVPARDALVRMAEDFRWSPEAAARFPVLDPATAAEATETDVRGFLETAYTAVFNRRPDEAGAAFWTETLLARIREGADIGSALVDIIAAARDAKPGAPDSRNDATTVINKIAVANATYQHVEDMDLRFGSDLQVAEIAALIETVTDRYASVDAALLDVAAIGIAPRDDDLA